MSEKVEDMTIGQMDDLILQLDYQELHHLRGTISERMKEMRDTGITQLRATIAEQATLLGVEIKDLVPKKTRKKRKQKEDIDNTE
jgi:hypothetical protein